MSERVQGESLTRIRSAARLDRLLTLFAVRRGPPRGAAAALEVAAAARLLLRSDVRDARKAAEDVEDDSFEACGSISDRNGQTPTRATHRAQQARGCRAACGRSFDCLGSRATRWKQTFLLEDAREGAHRVEYAERENHDEHRRQHDDMWRIFDELRVNLGSCQATGRRSEAKRRTVTSSCICKR